MKIYTIKEIAKMADVSAGTVDRVLHKRGKVSPDKEQKVNDILEKIDYKPNLIARSLKMNKHYRIVALMPDDQQDEYWRPCFDGIGDLMDALEEKGVMVDFLRYSPDSPSQFMEICNKSLVQQPDGVLLGALFLKESEEYLAKLGQENIPFTLFNTAVEKSNYKSFVGQNLVQSGRTAAHLFDAFLPGKKKILIVHIKEEFENAIHMQQKEEGFKSYFSNDRENTSIVTLNLKSDSTLAKELRNGIQNGADGIFVTTSKAHLIAEENLNIPIIGYDLLNENIQNLKDGKIKFLIYQNPKLQAFLGLSYLSELLIKNIKPPKEKYLPIEIINSENVNSYSL